MSTNIASITDSRVRRHTAVWLYALALAIRLAVLPLTDNEDGDAMARVLYARAFAEHGALPSSLSWLPGHFAFLAIPKLLLGLDDQLTMVVWTATVSALAVPLLYLIFVPWAGQRSAILSAVVLACLGLHVRFSVITVAEGPYIAFFLFSYLMFVWTVDSGQWRALVSGALSVAAAASMRFEAWLLPAAIVGGSLLAEALIREPISLRRMARSIVYGAAAAIFPVAWTIYSYSRFGDPFFIQNQTLQFTRAHPDLSPGIVDAVTFWPGLLLFAMGPLSALVGLAGAVSFLRNRHALRLLAPVGASIAALVWMYGGWLTARYGLLPLVILCGFVGVGAERLLQSVSGQPAGRRLWYVVPVAAACWLILIPIVVAVANPWLSEKAYQVSPLARFDREIVGVDGYLRANGARDGVIVIATGGGAGQWLSLADEWYDTQVLDEHIDRRTQPRQLYFTQSDAAIGTIVASAPRGHIVVAREVGLRASLPEPAVESGCRLSTKTVFRNHRFTVHRWERVNSGSRVCASETSARAYND